MVPPGNIRTPNGYHHQDPPPKPFDWNTLIVYAIGATIFYNALPRGINTPVAFIILGAGGWRAGHCSCKCLQEFALSFFSIPPVCASPLRTNSPQDYHVGDRAPIHYPITGGDYSEFDSNSSNGSNLDAEKTHIGTTTPHNQQPSKKLILTVNQK